MTDTTNLGLHRPSAGDASWDVPINLNADTLDALFAASGGTHDHSGTAGHGQKLTQANTHQSPDTDASTSALHHTLGTGANQAAAGNHTHTGYAQTANNLSDLASAATARTNLGLGTAATHATGDYEPALGNPGTDGYVLSSTAAGVRSWAAPGTGGGGLTNPMTAPDDLIIGGASGAPTRLAKGADGQVLTVDPTTHHLVWATPGGGGGGGAPTSAPYVTTASDSTLSAEVAIPGLAGSADRLGAFGSTIVEDFNTTTEGLTWVPSAPTAHDSNTTIPSWLYARITDGVTRHGKRAFAPTGSFDLRAKMGFGFDGNPGGAGTASGGGLCVLDASDNNIFLLQYSVQRDGTSLLGCYTGAGFTATVGTVNAGLLGTVYLRIARSGTSTLSGYWSTDGLLWTRFGTITLATTVASAALRIYGAAGTAEMACDWLRATG